MTEVKPINQNPLERYIKTKQNRDKWMRLNHKI